MTTFFINGKFSAQRTTGVQRLASGLVEALDRRLRVAGSRDRWVLLCPPGAHPPALSRIEVRYTRRAPFGLHGWEQLYLPLYTCGRTLLNLSGPAPALKLRQVCMLPDAAVFDFPDAYRGAFGRWYRFLFRRVSRSARLLLTISEFSRQRLVGALGPAAARARVIHCGAGHLGETPPDPGVLARLGLRQATYLLAVGSLNPTKNLPALVAAFRAVERDDVRLVLVGGGNAMVFSAQSPLGLDDARVIATGAVADAELAALYRHARAFVFPSLYEGFGLPPLEAMSLGCPVVAARAASIPEICADAALYFDPRSVADITAALNRVLGDDALCEDLCRRGAERVRAFTWDQSAVRLLDAMADAGLMPPGAPSDVIDSSHP